MKILILAGTKYNGFTDVLLNKKINSVIVLSPHNPKSTNEYYEKFSKEHKDHKAVMKSPQITWKNYFDNFDYILSIGWRKILKSNFFDVFLDSIKINIHPALLPAYKGYHTEPYILMNNEKEHGVTAHILTEKLDEGDIILQKSFEIGEYDTVSSLKIKVNRKMPDFFNELFQLMQEGLTLKNLVPQVGNVKVVAPKRNPIDSQIDSQKSIEELFHTIRACQSEEYMPFFTRKDGVKVYIKIFTDRINKDKGEI